MNVISLSELNRLTNHYLLKDRVPSDNLYQITKPLIGATSCSNLSRNIGIDKCLFILYSGTIRELATNNPFAAVMELLLRYYSKNPQLLCEDHLRSYFNQIGAFANISPVESDQFVQSMLTFIRKYHSAEA